MSGIEAYRDAQTALDMHERTARRAPSAAMTMRGRALEARVQAALAGLSDDELDALVMEMETRNAG